MTPEQIGIPRRYPDSEKPEEKIDHLREEKTPQDLELEEKDRRIAELESQVETLTATVKRLEHDLERATAVIGEHLESIAGLEEVNATLKNTIATIEDTTKELKRQIHELSHDSVTGLEIRRRFYEKLNNQVYQKLYEVAGIDMDELENAEFEDFADTILGIDIELLKKIELSVMMGDVAYLSLANNDNHATGDSLLRKIGQIARETSEKEESLEFFRTGGDELNGIFCKGKEESKEFARQFSKRVNEENLEYFSSLGMDDPSLKIDIGIASFLDGFEAYREYIKKISELKMEIPKGRERFKHFIDIWVEVADQRAKIRKARNRIIELCDYRRKHHMQKQALKEQGKKSKTVFEEIFSFLAKGGLSISPRELDKLNKLRDSEGEGPWKEAIWKFIDKRERLNLERQQRLAKARKRIVVEVADKDVGK